MKPELQHITIAAAVGLDRQPDADMPDCYVYADVAYPLDEWPDFTGCLNAMREAEKVLTTPKDQREFLAHLAALTGWDRDILLFDRAGLPTEEMIKWIWDTACASAALRAEAFLRTLNLWTES